MLILSTWLEVFNALKAILTAIAGVGNSVTGWIVSGAIIASRRLEDLQRLVVNRRNKTACTKN
jgi:hypothetical protein